MIFFTVDDTSNNETQISSTQKNGFPKTKQNTHGQKDFDLDERRDGGNKKREKEPRTDTSSVAVCRPTTESKTAYGPTSSEETSETGVGGGRKFSIQCKMYPSTSNKKKKKKKTPFFLQQRGQTIEKRKRSTARPWRWSRFLSPFYFCISFLFLFRIFFFSHVTFFVTHSPPTHTQLALHPIRKSNKLVGIGKICDPRRPRRPDQEISGRVVCKS